ncbi:hypothetical protein [Aliiroseovarius sediminis]|uniref:DUF6924 domain-containing protein n=1 Tax=Aliiroseovarius sediminis TaxID=2925839 RepID=UPI001F572597|nr:hypothetical protein [Aliiroseovarius sediminis]MCI2395488.1 hypothetical protein [Aliiroseovarius sediminis]
MEDELSPFVQTDFSDLSKWTALLDEVAKENEMGFRAYIAPVSEPRFSGANPKEVVAAFPDASVVFIVDKIALEKREILCVDVEDATAMFRAKADDLWIVENNVSIGNLLFEELLEQVGEDGVLTTE